MPSEKIQIDRLALDGDGIGRLSSSSANEGLVAFVPYTIPGELVQAELLFQKKRHSRWIPRKIVRSSAERIEPFCPYHFKPGQEGPWCGGCSWQHLAIPLQIAQKRRLLEETLTRLGGIQNPPLGETIPSGQSWRYRNKVQVPFGRAGKKVVAGFYAPDSHELVAFDDCLIQTEGSIKIVRAVCDFANAVRWFPYDADAQKGWLRHLLIRVNRRGQALVTLVTAGPAFPHRNEFVRMITSRFPDVIGIHQNVQKARTNVILGNRWFRLWGAEKIEESISGLTIACSAGSFFQVNTPVAERLYEAAIRELSLNGNELVVDLYCGVGTMALLAAARSNLSLGIEVVPSAIRDARENARLNKVQNAEFVEGEAGRMLKEFIRPRLQGIDNKSIKIIVDPPRSGCEPQVLSSLLEIRPARIVYVSCHPATLARDLKVLMSRYRLRSVIPVDLFPQTPHIETIASLELGR